MAPTKRTRVWGLSVVTAAAAIVGAGAAAAFTAGAAGTGRGTLTAAFGLTADWGSGFQAEYTISNGTGRAVSGWNVSFDLPPGERISSLWNGTMSVDGRRVTVAAPPGGGARAAGATAACGFVVDAAGGSGPPRNCVINGAACGSGASGTAPAAGGAPGSPVSDASAASASASGSPTGGPASASSSQSAQSSQSPTPPFAPFSAMAPPASGGSYRFAPYVDTSQRQDLGALAAAAGTKYVTAGFVLSAGGCATAWNGSADPAFAARLKAGLADLRAAGGDAIVSFGGANGTEPAESCPDVAGLKAAYQAVIDEYGLTHLDFDIEGPAGADRASITRRSQALAALQREYAAAGRTLDVSLTLPVLPSGLTDDGLAVVAGAAANGLRVSVVNVLAMDYGDWAAPSPAGRMGQYAVQAAQSLHDQLKTVYPDVADAGLWAMTGLTPMIGVNDTADEVFQLADAQAVTLFAAQHHLGRLAMWSLTRDTACARPTPRADPTCSSIQQTAYGFSHTFGAFAD